MSKINLWKGLEETDLEEYTVIIPSVAVGNVGQLACDLLISSLNMGRVASVHSPALIPVTGYNPYDLKSDVLTCSCELYKSEKKKIGVLQLRSPLVYKYAKSFLEEIVQSFIEKRVKDIIILTSSHAYEKKHIQTSPYRYIANKNSLYEDKIKALNLIEHKNQDSSLKIFGGGFASLLYKTAEEKSIPCVVLYKYCSEGDNIPDAYDMVHLLSGLKALFEDQSNISSQLVQPVSWNLLFGRPPPIDIY